MAQKIDYYKMEEKLRLYKYALDIVLRWYVEALTLKKKESLSVKKDKEIIEAMKYYRKIALRYARKKY